MWSVGYKGATLHGYFDRDEVRVVFLRQSGATFVKGPFPSRRSAERFVRQAIKDGHLVAGVWVQ